MPDTSRNKVPRSGCPIGIALDTLGDRWSLLLVRDLMFDGPRRFVDFAAAPERIATNILADRLRRLEHAGIIVAGPDANDARGTIYYLTAKGAALAPVLLEIVVWTAQHETTDAPPQTVRRFKQRRSEVLQEIAARWRRFERDRLASASSPSP